MFIIDDYNYYLLPFFFMNFGIILKLLIGKKYNKPNNIIEPKKENVEHNRIDKILFIKTITTGENPYYHKIKELFINYNNKINGSITTNENISFNIKLLGDSIEYLEENQKKLNEFLNNYLLNDITLFISGFNNDIHFIKNYLYKDS